LTTILHCAAASMIKGIRDILNYTAKRGHGELTKVTQRCTLSIISAISHSKVNFY